MRRFFLSFLLAAAVMVGIAVLRLSRSPETVEVEDPGRITIKMAEGLSYAESQFGRNLDISPDGNKLVYVASDGSWRRLYLHTIGEPAPIGLPGTEDADDPSFSPDGRYIVFYSEGRVKRTTVDGGGTTVIGAAPPPRGVTWLDAETLILGNTEGGLLRMPLAQGEPALLAPVQFSSLARLSPQTLPNNKAVLFTGERSNLGAEPRNR
jgi:hypothetical protein